MSQQKTNVPAPLTNQLAAQIAAGIGRRAQLEESLGSGIITPDTEAQKAELNGINTFLTRALSAHAAELIGCYHMVRSEYEPLLRAIHTVGLRTGIVQIPEQPSAAPEQPAPAPANVESINGGVASPS